MRIACPLVIAVGCSSSPSPAPQAPVPAPVVTADAAPPPPPDAGVPEAVLNAPAWVFRYNTPGRVETWTLRYAGDQALLVVEAASGTAKYFGSVANATSLKLALAAPTAQMNLECKPVQKAIGKKCNDAKAPKLDVLDCYHPDFKEPMTFGQAPGVEFAQVDGCTGYRLIGG